MIASYPSSTKRNRDGVTSSGPKFTAGPTFSRKRQRSGCTQETERNVRSKIGPTRFRLFEELLKHQDILLYLTTQHMEPRELFLLYQISKGFHFIVNQSMTSYILSSARRWARLTATRPSPDVDRTTHTDIPGLAGNDSVRLHSFRSKTTSSRRVMLALGTEPTPPGAYSQHDITTILPYRCYAHFCVVDPGRRDFSADQAQRQKKQKPVTWLAADLPDPHDTNIQPRSGPAQPTPRPLFRDVPTFRYLGFLLHRARNIQLIIHHLAQHGHRVPVQQTPAVLAKLSLILDIPTTARRAAAFRNKQYWTNKDLFIANLFLVKLDMCFTDPVDGIGELGLRKLLLAQPGLEALEATLSNPHATTSFDIVKLYVRTFHVPAPANRHLSIFSIPPSEIGKTCLEGWGKPAWEYDPAYARKLDSIQAERMQMLEYARRHRSGAAGVPLSPRQVVTQFGPQIEPPRRRLQGPDEFVIGEAVRRQLPLHWHLPRMVCYGYFDPETGEELPDPADGEDGVRERDGWREGLDEGWSESGSESGRESGESSSSSGSADDSSEWDGISDCEETDSVESVEMDAGDVGESEWTDESDDLGEDCWDDTEDEDGVELADGEGRR